MAGIRTGRQYLDGLKDGREVWIDGERITDVTTDRRFRGGAQTMAELLDMQHEPGLVERMTYVSPASGARVGLSHISPETCDDLIPTCGDRYPFHRDYFARRQGALCAVVSRTSSEAQRCIRAK